MDVGGLVADSDPIERVTFSFVRKLPLTEVTSSLTVECKWCADGRGYVKRGSKLKGVR